MRAGRRRNRLCGLHCCQLLVHGHIVVHKAHAAQLQTQTISRVLSDMGLACVGMLAVGRMWDRHVWYELTCAIATAMSTSVTVSMGELTAGVPRRTFLVSCVDRST